MVGRIRFVICWGRYMDGKRRCMVGWSRFIMNWSWFVMNWSWIRWVIRWWRCMEEFRLGLILGRGIIRLAKVDKSKQTTKHLHSSV